MPDVSGRMTRMRSLLFVPGTQADMIAKIPRFGPDVAVVDLEDAVAPTDKAAARSTAAVAIDSLDAGRTTVLIRINPVDSAWFGDDLASAAACAAVGVVVPKLSTLDQLRRLRAALDELSWPSAVVVAGIETALGVADARPLLASGVSAAYFGAEDYIADIGGRRTPGGDEVLYARSQVCLAAHLAGIPAVDQAVVVLGDDEQFRADAAAGAAIGYQGKICIHPRQVELAHDAFTPGPDAIAHARAVLSAGAGGVGVVDGQMVDDVHLRIARTVLARASQDPVGRE
ncbi:MAG: CoA ester lyase [Jatrophihabitantaceae bacterium]